MSGDETKDSLLRRLRSSADLSEDDAHAIRRLPITLRRARSGEQFISTGDRPSACCLIVDGFVIRSKVVGDGNRQVLSFHQPGDIPDLQSLFLHVLDHDLSTMGETLLGFIPHSSLRKLIKDRPNIAEIFWRDTLIEAAIFREWICNVGQRPAPNRLAHLVLELYTRLKLIGHTDGLSFRFPATQAVLGEAIGITPVHVNRVIQDLRSQEIIELEKGTVKILNEETLRSLADFDPLYLHLNPSL
jgi:CRP-like cAMP-binding protein